MSKTVTQDLVCTSADPREDPSLGPLLDAAFERTDAESRLVQRLAEQHPEFDPESVLVARRGDRAVGCALFMPRTLRLFGAWVRVVVSSPFGVLPEARRDGVASRMLEVGMERAVARGARGAVVLGGGEFFRHRDFAPAFRMHVLQVRTGDLPEPDETGWRGLQGEDLARLVPLSECCYGETDGAERRAAIPLEWESQVETGHVRVLEEDGELLAAVRFRTDSPPFIREVVTGDPRAHARVLAFVAHIASIHSLDEIELSLPPTHPIARALFHRGALALSNDFRGSALLRVVDWRGLLEDAAGVWCHRLGRIDGRPLSLHLGGQDLCLRTDGEDPTVEQRREESRHLFVPAHLAPSLVTGHRSWRDLVDDQEVRSNSQLDEIGWHAVKALFPDGEPHWSYGPVFELADR